MLKFYFSTLIGKADTIDLSNNSLVELSAEDFKSCSQIKTLVLKNNPIQRFSGTTFIHMKKIGRIILSKNTASCWTTDDVQSLLQLKTKTKFKLEIVDWFPQKNHIFFKFCEKSKKYQVLMTKILYILIIVFRILAKITKIIL